MLHIKEILLVRVTQDSMTGLKNVKTVQLILVSQRKVLKVLRICFIQWVEPSRMTIRQLKQCTERLMETMHQENKKIETMNGNLTPMPMYLAMEKKE